MTPFEKQKYYKFILPAVFTVLFIVAVLVCVVFAIKSGKTVKPPEESESETEYLPPPVDPAVTEKYGEYAVFDGYFNYGERIETKEISVVVEEPDGSIVKETEVKKTLVPVLTACEGCFILNEKGKTRVLSSDGSTLLQSVVTIFPAGVSFDGLPLFSVSGRTVTADGKAAVAAETVPPYSLKGGKVFDAKGVDVVLPSGFEFIGCVYKYMVLKSVSSGLCGLYAPVEGWLADPVYDEITSAGSTAFAAKTDGGVLLVSYSGEHIVKPGAFTEITVSGTVAAAYSAASGWVAFDLANVKRL